MFLQERTVKKIWDDTLKRLIKANPQDFVSLVLKDAEHKAALGTELKNWTVEADVLLDVVQGNERVLLHIEFQSKKDTKMAQRLLEYNVLATREHKCHIISCVIYLRQDDTITEKSPLRWALPDGQTILTFHYMTIKLWEIAAQELLQSGLVGLYPLLPLTEDGKQLEVVDQMIEGIATAGQWNLLPLGQIIAGLVFTGDVEYEQMLRRFTMFGDYILEDSRVYQDILRKGMVQGVKKGLKQGIEQGVKQGVEQGDKQGVEQGVEQGIQRGTEQARKQELARDRQIILTIVQGRFPDLLNLTRQYIEGIHDPEQLQALVIKVSLAQDTHEARLALAEAERDRE